MSTLHRTLAASLLSLLPLAGALAQNAGPPPVLPLAAEPAPRLTVYAPVPEALARGVVILQFRTEHLRIMPVFGAKAAEVSPHLGHLHITVDDWHGTWAHTSNDPLILVGLTPGPHKILMEMADPNHKMVGSETVRFTVPDSKAAHAHHAQPPTESAMKIETIQVSPGLQLRRMVLRPALPKGTVLLLHGFPETLYAWKEVAEALSRDYEVHAFDWPGFGQSQRPAASRFAYAPADYATVLQDYVRASGIDSASLVIYATDIGALPALLAAVKQPAIARHIIVGDFAPFNRPQYMFDSLQGLKSQPSASVVHAAMNSNRDEILENAFRRGLQPGEQYELQGEYKQDLAAGWRREGLTPADAFYHYYAHFTRDQDYLEANLARLKTPVTVLWGEKDIYIRKEMGAEFAAKIGVQQTVLPGIGHYPHLQDPKQAAEHIRAAFGAPPALR